MAPSRSVGPRARLALYARLASRCLLAAVPTALAARKRNRRLRGAFRAVVEPVLATVISDDDRRREIAGRLLPWGIQGGFLIDTYACTATGRSVPEVAALAAVFTRLYDDMLDEAPGGCVGDGRGEARTAAQRLGRMFSGEALGAVTDLERMIEALYHRLASLAPRSHHEPSYRALVTLHRVQIWSLCQVGAPLSNPQLWKLTCAKGGLAMVVLGGLVRPGLTPMEEGLLHRLGAFLQLVDDYQDQGVDRRCGIRTLATSGALTFAGLVARLRRLDRQLRTGYGAGAARPFVNALYLWLGMVGLTRLVRGRSSLPRHAGPWVRQLTRGLVVLRRETVR